jgi:hypothetical protein
MASLGFNRLIDVLLPGFLAAVAVWLLADRFLSDGPVRRALHQLLESEWRFAFAALLASALMGSLLRSLLGLIEAIWIDPRSARKLSIPTAEFDEEWDGYVDSLDSTQNPYISNLALAFFFESRGGVATIALGLSVGVWMATSAGWMAGVTISIAGLAMFLAALRTHRALAEYRHRKFGADARIKVEPGKD